MQFKITVEALDLGESSKLQILLITKCLIITDEPNDNNINHKQTHKVSNKNCVKNHVA